MWQKLGDVFGWILLAGFGWVILFPPLPPHFLLIHKRSQEVVKFYAHDEIEQIGIAYPADRTETNYWTRDRWGHYTHYPESEWNLVNEPPEPPAPRQ